MVSTAIQVCLPCSSNDIGIQTIPKVSENHARDTTTKQVRKYPSEANSEICIALKPH